MSQCSIVLLLADDRFRDITEFDSFEDIGEVQEVLGLPDGITLNAANFAALKEYASLFDDEQEVILAYYRATDTFNPEEAQEAYAGTFTDGAEFAQVICEGVEYEALRSLPDYLRDCIKWSDVWDCFLHYDYFEQAGHYFRNL